MLLCDGMGTGKPAAVDGQMAAKLTAQLLQAGFAAESAARLVNVALGLKNAGQESGATLDLLTLDLYTGGPDCSKRGGPQLFMPGRRCAHAGWCQPAHGGAAHCNGPFHRLNAGCGRHRDDGQRRCFVRRLRLAV